MSLYVGDSPRRMKSTFYPADYDTPGFDALYKPTLRERIELANDGVNDATAIIKTKAPNGDTIKVAQNANGETVAVKKENNVLPLAALAAAAYFLFV